MSKCRSSFQWKLRKIKWNFMNKKTNAYSLAILSAVLCANAWAIEPQGIKLIDGLTFTPSLQVSERYDDNFRAEENGEEQSWITNIAPIFVLEAERSQSLYRLSYKASSDIFHSSRQDNNTDHYLNADAGFEFDDRNRLKLNAAYDKVEETASQDQALENDKYTTGNVGGVYTYGTRSARTQVDFGANYSKLRYQNSGGLNSDKERDTIALNSTLYYRVAPRTKALIEARHTEYNYDSNIRLNSKNIALLSGVTWDATAKTSGTIKLGAERKRFDNASIDDKSGSLWEVGINWKPLTYSTFKLETRRALDEGSDGATSVKNISSTVSWEHQWLERLSSEFNYTRSDQKYQNIERDDKIDTFGLGVTYNMRRWLDVGLGYKYSRDESTLKSESYERNIYMISFAASL